MSRASRADAFTRLAAADPARAIAVNADARAALWRRIEAGEGNRAPLYPDRPAPRVRARAVLALVVLLLAVLGALAAGGVIEIGSRAKLPFSLLSDAAGGSGRLLPGSVHQLPIAAPDPAGGPPWGMRELATSNGMGCLQFGRIVDGKLGALGQDHAFGDDGRFHELPVGTDVNGCALLDADHRLFANVVADERPASAWPGVGGRSSGCVPPTAGPYEKGLRLTPAERAHGARPAAICPQSDLRNIYYGLLGPRAQSITYVLGGHRHTLDTVGPEGAYMFVTRASAHQLLNFADAGTADVVPVDGPIREIHYRDGATCHLTAKSWIGGAYACTPSLPEPYGYAIVGHAPSAAEARAAIHARVRRGRGGRYVLLVSFRVPLPITDARRIYTVYWRETGMAPGAYAGTWIEQRVVAGTVVTKTIGGIGPRLRPGLIRGSVVLRQALGAGGLEGPGSVARTVGRFSVRVP
ncbi:MAG TPA: hypothetical protein VNY34_04085 [Solirubrobacteraceae bacterium]|nr:hypothetical protein [Solirubrobacteraceae bacterium]